MTIAATDGIDEAEQGLAGGLFNASVQFGAALILAIVTAVNVVATDGRTTEAALLDGYRAALIVPLVAVLVALAITASGSGAGEGAEPPASHRRDTVHVRKGVTLRLTSGSTRTGASGSRAAGART